VQRFRRPGCILFIAGVVLHSRRSVRAIVLEKGILMTAKQVTCPTVVVFLLPLLLGTIHCSKPKEAAVVADAPMSTTSFKYVPPVETKGPIAAMMMASSIDDHGQAVKPQFTFPPDEKQITVIVRVGEVTGSLLNLTWYRISKDRDERLFEHTVDVNSYDRAYSTGKNPGAFGNFKLATGTYKIIATLEGQKREVGFDVSVPEGQSQLAKQSEAAQAMPPLPGESGRVPRAAAKSDEAGDCSIHLEGQNPDNDAFVVDVNAVKLCMGRLTPVDVAAFIEGKPIQVRLVGDPKMGNYEIQPCPGGSDGPGTKVTVTALDRESLFGSQKTIVIELGADTKKPYVKLITTRDGKVLTSGTPVKTDDRIEIFATAREELSGGPWQSGVKILQVLDESATNPLGKLGEYTNPSKRSLSCDAKTEVTVGPIVYKVPEKHDKFIVICAETADYAENPAGDCHKFPTGVPYKGKYKYRSSRKYFSNDGASLVSTCTDEYAGTLTFSVAPDGSLVGTASGSPTREVCPGTGGMTLRQATDYTVTGRKTASAFELYFKFDDIHPPVSVDMGGGMILSDYMMGCAGMTQPPKIVLPMQGPDAAAGTFDLDEMPWSAEPPNCHGSRFDVFAVHAQFSVKRWEDGPAVSERRAIAGSMMTAAALQEALH